jgi:hypothetical protein
VRKQKARQRRTVRGPQARLALPEGRPIFAFRVDDKLVAAFRKAAASQGKTPGRLAQELMRQAVDRG